MKILVVDDAQVNREILSDLLEEDYEIEMAEDGESALRVLDQYKDNISAVLLDLHMPGMNGFDVLDEMGRRGYMKRLPVLIISAESAVSAEKKCLELGVADFIHRPFAADIVRNRIKNSITLYTYKNHLEEKVSEQVKLIKKQCEVLKLQKAELKKSNERLIEILANVVENRNLESGQHIKRVKGFTKILAYQVMQQYPEYKLDENLIEKIVATSSLHDVGKIAITDKILLKPGRLTADEFEYMKSHTTRGCEIINGIEGVWDEEYRKICYDICRHHHERYDGKGYPDGLKGDDIPIAAQIVSVADVYDALVCERVYKEAIPKEKAYHMILAGECGVFSPKLMECFRASKESFEKLADAL